MQLIQKQGPHKIDFRADGTHESHPTAWELKLRYILENAVFGIRTDSDL